MVASSLLTLRLVPKSPTANFDDVIRATECWKKKFK